MEQMSNVKNNYNAALYCRRSKGDFQTDFKRKKSCSEQQNPDRKSDFDTQFLQSKEQ